ncbi:MAG TPA: hypothetical protein VIC71_03950 [Gammaproteobacteria bacterium]|jgi:hypothetical protein
MRRLLVPTLSALLGAAAGGCGSDDPQAEVREFLAEAERAAEARDTGFFRDAISPSYADRRGQRRDDVINVLRGIFLTNTTIEVISRIETIELAGSDAATVKLQAALVGKREGSALLDVDGDFYGIDLELVRESGDWRVISADWER